MPSPLYPFAAAVLANKLREAGLQGKVPPGPAPGQPFSLGPFQLRYLTMTHSLPRPRLWSSLRRRARCFTPAIGSSTARPGWGCLAGEHLRALGDRGIDALVGDSTNALTPGYSLSEGSLERTWRSLFKARRDG